MALTGAIRLELPRLAAFKRCRDQERREGWRNLGEARSRLRVPIVAIGGITPGNAGALLAAGADWLAVVSAVFGADDVRAAARRFTDLIEIDRAPGPERAQPETEPR